MEPPCERRRVQDLNQYTTSESVDKKMSVVNYAAGVVWIPQATVSLDSSERHRKPYFPQVDLQ